MPMLMIKCPSTGKPVPTGIVWDLATIDSLKLETNAQVTCPHCKQEHSWNKADVLKN